MRWRFTQGRFYQVHSLGYAAWLILVPSPATRAQTECAKPTAADKELSGGETTVFDTSPKVFGFPAQNLREEHRAAFFVGRSFFNENWVVAPASTTGRDGLGPLFNARSCSACHLRDGRSAPPPAGQPMVGMLMRVSVLGAGPHHEPIPDPTYGGQIQGQAIPGVPAEADVYVQYQELPGKYADGEAYSLRKPAYSITNLGYGPMAKEVLLSPRVAPAMVGVGLLEAVSEETLRQFAAEQRRQSHGIAGKLNLVWDKTSQKMTIGRYGWKAEQPSVLQQTAGAFAGDIGITSTLFPEDDHTTHQQICDRQPSGGQPEVSDKILHDVVTYCRALAVPARRNSDEAIVLRGQSLFRQAQCAACHIPKMKTGECPDLPELSHQTIYPYTDLLLHDLGEGLTDNRPVFEAGGRDWRTAPLWGIGLVPKVNGHSCLLHDGRARNVAEAILWHGGEAEAARESFRAFSRDEREALIAFVQSL